MSNIDQSWSFAEAAKMFGVPKEELIEKLQELGWIERNESGEWIATEKAVQDGFMTNVKPGEVLDGGAQ